jgi:poly(A) polymerase
VIDYHNGVADLKQKTLRMIGEPRARYREDPVRMLRAVRLAAKLGLVLDPGGTRPDPRHGRVDRERAGGTRFR